MIRFGSALVGIAAALAVARPADACTTFLVGDTVGKCYDWSMGQGMVVLNPRGLAKAALPMAPDDRPARWNAEHASITFNQYGRELPNGGMNDAGLVVEVMWLDETSLPSADARPTVNELQWIQWALDRWGSVKELAAHAEEIRVSRVSGRVHYLACDKSHACAAFEYVGGKLVVSQGAGLLAPVLTNNTYADSSAALQRHLGFGGAEGIPTGAGSLDRFVRAASMVRAGEPARKILESVRNRTSQWEIVYDLAHLKVSWQTRGIPSLKEIDFGQLAAGCDQPVKMIDMDAPLAGDVTHRLVPYTQAADRALVEKSLARMKLPEGTAARVAEYPDRLVCAAR
jgi:penicillin V acylase-like amidase (Ntn superfamily)